MTKFVDLIHQRNQQGSATVASKHTLHNSYVNCHQERFETRMANPQRAYRVLTTHTQIG